MTVTTIVAEPGTETEIPETDAASSAVVAEAAAEAAVVTADAAVTLAEAEIAAVTLRSEDEIRKIVGGLETWQVEVGRELSALNQAVQELRDATALLTGVTLANNSPPSTPETSTPSETVEVETPTTAVTITEPQENDDNTPSAETKRPRRWT